MTDVGVAAIAHGQLLIFIRHRKKDSSSQSFFVHSARFCSWVNIWNALNALASHLVQVSKRSNL